MIKHFTINQLSFTFGNNSITFEIGSCPSAMWKIVRKNIERFQWCLAPVNTVVMPQVIDAVNTVIRNNYQNESLGLYPTNLDMSSIGDQLYYRAFAIMVRIHIQQFMMIVLYSLSLNTFDVVKWRQSALVIIVLILKNNGIYL